MKMHATIKVTTENTEDTERDSHTDFSLLNSKQEKEARGVVAGEALFETASV